MNEAKDEELNVKRLSRKYKEKEKIIENMIIIAKQFNLDKEIEELIKEFYWRKKLMQ